MAPYLGKFVWYELMTTDATAAANFYAAAVGWTSRDAGSPSGNYTLFLAGERMVGGLMVLPEQAKQMGARPGWIGYIAVDDVDAYCQRVKDAGGSIHRPPEDIPNVGRFAVAADPFHAAFILFTPLPGMDGTGPDMTQTGQVGWNELYAGDLNAAFAFYEKLFGWTKGDAMDMGPMGVYQMFAIQGTVSGGMMTRPPEAPASYWQYYINVDNITTAVERVRSHGGQVINGPHQVPTGSWIVHALDPQGVGFALVGPDAK